MPTAYDPDKWKNDPSEDGPEPSMLDVWRQMARMGVQPDELPLKVNRERYEAYLSGAFTHADSFPPDALDTFASEAHASQVQNLIARKNATLERFAGRGPRTDSEKADVRQLHADLVRMRAVMHDAADREMGKAIETSPTDANWRARYEKAHAVAVAADELGPHALALWVGAVKK